MSKVLRFKGEEKVKKKKKKSSFADHGSVEKVQRQQSGWLICTELSLLKGPVVILDCHDQLLNHVGGTERVFLVKLMDRCPLNHHQEKKTILMI
jgi:hypothetical protein